MHIVGLTRESDVGLAEFLKHDGFSVLLRAIQTDVEKLQVKAAFLMSVLCRQQHTLKGTHITYSLCRQRGHIVQ